MSADQTRKSVYFSSIELENIRCFGARQKLNLLDDQGLPCRWTLILGNNGVGKTTLLKCLTWMRPAPAPVPDNGSGNDNGQEISKVKPFLDEEDNSILEGLLRQGDEVKASLDAELVIGVSLASGQHPAPVKSKIAYGITIDGRRGLLHDYDNKPADVDNFHEMQIFAYGAGRHMEIRNIDNHELENPVLNLFSVGSVLYDAEEVLLQLDHQTLQKKGGNADKLLVTTKRLLSDLLPDVEDEDCIVIHSPEPLNSPPTPGKVLIRMPTGEVSLSDLGLGYKTMMAWAVDLALRLFQSNPESDSPLEEPSVVLVDEIDLHLHPSWQREVMGFLTGHFPNTQFICTAHGPVMAQASEDSNIKVLKLVGNEVQIDDDPESIRGWRVDQILISELYDLPGTRSSQVESLITERDSLLDKDDRSDDDDARLAELKRTLSTLPVEESLETQKAIDLIKRYAKMIENKGAEIDPYSPR